MLANNHQKNYKTLAAYVLNRGNFSPTQYFKYEYINKKWLLIRIQVIQTIVTECTIFNLQNKLTTEFESTLAIILKQLFAKGSVKKVE